MRRLVLLALLPLACGLPGDVPAPTPAPEPSGATTVDASTGLLSTWCDHGNRIYQNSSGRLVVIPKDDSCSR